MAIAVFDYAAWAALYPELADTVDETRAIALFNQAGLYLDNSDCSPVPDASQRLELFNMLVAHLAALGGAGGRPAGVVGRVGEATEGSVRVTLNAGAMTGSEAWYAQTSYGWQYWTATAALRTMHYVPGPDPVFDPFYPGFLYGGFYG